MCLILPPPRGFLPVLQKVKTAYLLWHEYHQILSKTQRYSLGQKIDNLLTETIEAIATAAFLQKAEKLPYVRRAIQKIDTTKIFLMILWETKSLPDKKYLALSVQLDEIGKMLGGWNGQLIKAYSTAYSAEIALATKAGKAS
ncbi:MAG: four helix bundle protein [Candidatus Komeilibacteria bacterium]|nr:four helix bundle protein [Candidatus Komeilibacteria bacterium]